MESDLDRPHSGRALRVFGPPGTGKTTYLAKRVSSTVAEYGPHSTMISSFSRTAAEEIASRFRGSELRPDDKMIGTLHSHAWRAVGHPPVALDSKVIADWNEQVEPELSITGDTRRAGGSADPGGFVDNPADAVTGNELLAALDKLRASLTPPEDWPSNVRDFADRFTAWKRSIGAVDFTDMIEEAWTRARDGEAPPGAPSRFITDEAQDLTPLEFALSRAWGSLCDVWVIAGDDDQAINRWRGGDPAPLLALHGSDVTDHVLDRSYRVPESVRLAAEQWIRRVSHRQAKEYGSRVDDGKVVQGAAYHVPERIGDAALVAKALREIDAGRTVMILTACNYMLDGLVANLRAEGVPFHNPFRPGEAKWNPLGVSREGTTSTAERISRYMILEQRDWTGADIQAWSELVKLKPAGMRDGAKKMISRFLSNAAVPFEDIEALFLDEEALDAATQPSLDWLAGALLTNRRKSAEYPIQVARRHGASALAAPPRLVVGTIHSVKGAAADVVYLSPEIAPAAARSMAAGRAGVDETIRQMYVGMTRAYSELRVLTPVTRNSVLPTELIPAELEVFPE